MKEDVLEQVVDDYPKFNGYFTIHNIGFKPRPDHPDYNAVQDSVRSDVDVVGYHPGRKGVDKVVVVSCKAWQAGFDATAKLAELRWERPNPKRETWRHFRELWVPKWSEAFRAKISELTREETSPIEWPSPTCAATPRRGRRTRRSRRTSAAAQSNSYR